MPSYVMSRGSWVEERDLEGRYIIRNIILLKCHTEDNGDDFDLNGIAGQYYRGLCFERYREPPGIGVVQGNWEDPDQEFRWGLYKDQYDIFQDKAFQDKE